jgi:hypothetical protein
VALDAKDGKIWLNQQQMAELFATSKQTISYHIINILKEKELGEILVVKEYLTTAADGKLMPRTSKCWKTWRKVCIDQKGIFFSFRFFAKNGLEHLIGTIVQFSFRIFLSVHGLLNGRLSHLIGFFVHDAKQHTLHIVVQSAVLAGCVALQTFQKVCPQAE